MIRAILLARLGWGWPRALIVVVVLAGCASVCRSQGGVELPPPVRAVWEMDQAFHETSQTRERICLNGLWQWQPTIPTADKIPTESWGFFKTPGCWPGITDYMQKDCQRLYAHPAWKDQDLGAVSACWYQREVRAPAAWAGRRVVLSAQYVNSLAMVYLDGMAMGPIRFPGGEVDITSACRPGRVQVLTLLVSALPLKGVMLSYVNTAAANEIKGAVQRRGLCGDVYLASTPAGAHITDLRLRTSVRRGEVSVDVALADLSANGNYLLKARITDETGIVQELASSSFTQTGLSGDRLTFSTPWRPEKLWDIHTPGNKYRAQLSLYDAGGELLDESYPAPFGFREFWIEGRDFYLNGSRIYLSAVPLDNAQVGAAWATHDAAMESLRRLKTFGINFVYTHNYGCEPGAHLSFEEILRAADDVGMLVAFSQPHFSQYDWKDEESDRTNGYAFHAAFYVRAAQNHPSVVAYAMSHNATGYNEDMNPDMIDGVQDARDQWAQRNMRQALRAEAIVKRLDPSRLVYHHASGNLGSMHVDNFYLNFAPIQEVSDWFEHWATAGVKPLFLCEYGVPFSWDWTMYRGWYDGKREFGSAAVPWEFCLAEWNAQFLGSAAYRLSDMERSNLRWEAKQFRANRLWHRWDYPYPVGASAFQERDLVQAMYITDNWRAFRSWGVSATSPWEHGIFWRLRQGVDKSQKELPVNWQDLQRPGFSPDYIGQRYERMDLAFALEDWEPTAAAQALMRNNQPLLAFIGGRPGRFTSKAHDFCPGETPEKQLILINNSRVPVTVECQWSLDLDPLIQGAQQIQAPAGEQRRIPMRFSLPKTLAPGAYRARATARFSTGAVQEDSFTLDVVPRPATLDIHSKLTLYDPLGETRRLLARLSIPAQPLDEQAKLSADDILIVGRGALRMGGPAPDISAVPEGMRVIVFEQTAETLEKRLGFRVAEHGLRRAFARVPDHPILDGLGEALLKDWRGESTLTPPRLQYERSSQFNGAPVVKWCGIPVTRAWRCGNQGNVASVVIEKPARGNFLPILEAGYALQYSPLLEFREGQGLVVFCQLDLTARTAAEPVADLLARNIIEFVCKWKPSPARELIYRGDPMGKAHLQDAGFSVEASVGKGRPLDQLLVVGPGGSASIEKKFVAGFLKEGGKVVSVGLGQTEANDLFPFQASIKKKEHVAAYFDAPAGASPFAGIGPADIHNRDPREIPLVMGGASLLGDGVLAAREEGGVIFCQLAPWQFEGEHMNLKRTHRRLSYSLTRLLGNLGAASSTPLLRRFQQGSEGSDQRWLTGFYLDQPEEWDDPYRFFRW